MPDSHHARNPDDPADETDPAPEELAAWFPQYEIVRVLGRGEMGIVFLARHQRLDRLVALKLLFPGYGDGPEFAARFERESRTMARLNHPNIVGFYDSGQTTGGRFYVAMEYVEGAVLAEWIANPPAGFDARGIAVQVCDALAYAHGEGVVHRDIKPGNVLVDARGRVKVADFGLARLADATEQADDPRTDLFALGALIRAMLGGAREWDAIVSRAMHDDPAQRFASAAEMREALDSAPPVRMTNEPRRTNRTRGPLVVLAIVLLLAVGGWMVWDKRPPVPTVQPAATPAPAYPSSMPWVDATAELRESALAKKAGSVEGEWLHISKPSFYTLAGKRVMRDVAMRLTFTGAAGTHVRQSASTELYVVEVNTLSKLALFVWDSAGNRKVNSGPELRLGDAFDLKSEHELTVVAQGDRFTAWLDGGLMIDHRDSTLGEGTIGLNMHEYARAPEFAPRIKKVEYADLDPLSEGLPGSVSSAATKDTPFENTLGMKFVPVPITGPSTGSGRVLFSVWETRVQDYATFATETKREWPKPGFEQSATHPAVNVNWGDAQAFCAWLTGRERKAGKLGANERYRLPTDHEWSCAVGIGEMEDAAESPASKNRQSLKVYPWGAEVPEKKLPGNYACAELLPVVEAGNYTAFIPKERLFMNHRDDYTETAPVGSFPANAPGLYDLGGNVWEWCEDWGDETQKLRVLRGASWAMVLFQGGYDYLRSNSRFMRSSEDRIVHFGFRPVLAPAPKQ